MMRLDPADFQDPACTCAVGVLCQACSADLALLASHTDPLGQIAAELHTKDRIDRKAPARRFDPRPGRRFRIPHQTREETSS